MTCKDTVRVRRDDGREEEVPIDDLFEPIDPGGIDDFDPFDDTAGGDPGAIDRLQGGARNGIAAADGEDTIGIIVRVLDTQSRGVANQTVTVADKDGLTMPDSKVTDEAGEVRFDVTSNTKGNFEVSFKHPDTDYLFTSFEFQDPATFEEPYNPPFSENADLTESEAVSIALDQVAIIRDLLSQIEPQDHPVITEIRVQKTDVRAKDLQNYLKRFEDTGTVSSYTFSFNKAFYKNGKLGTTIEQQLQDSTYNRQPLIDAVEKIGKALGEFLANSGFGASSGDGSDSPLGETGSPAEWKEKERTTSTIDVDGTEVTRIDTVTFRVPGGKEVKLVLNHPES